MPSPLHNNGCHHKLTSCSEWGWVGGYFQENSFVFLGEIVPYLASFWFQQPHVPRWMHLYKNIDTNYLQNHMNLQMVNAGFGQALSPIPDFMVS